MKATVQAGYTKNTLENYHYWSRKNLSGADIRATDGIGNLIEIGVRECQIAGQPTGFRIWINGKEISQEGMGERQDEAT